MTIIGLDPGYERSAMVVLRDGVPDGHWLEPNDVTLYRLRTRVADGPACQNTLVIEQIESFGMPVGREVFETVWWSGRFTEAWGGDIARVPRRAVKLALCQSPKANDASIRQALIDHFGPGREKAIGTKKAPGPLYGLKADLWAALAVAETYRRQRAEAGAA